MNQAEVIPFLAAQRPSDILCLGSRTGDMSDALNSLELQCPEKFNKATVYASIADDDAMGRVEPNKETAIFTTFDSSKGLERPICVIFDFTEAYWLTRVRKPQQSSKILRNIFCVAASRGKAKIVFVENKQELLSPASLASNWQRNDELDDVDISGMFDFKYKEDVEDCFRLLHIQEIPRKERSVIKVNDSDGMIDLSTCIGIYQEAAFFRNYSIDAAIEQYMSVNQDQKFKFSEEVRRASLEYKILFLTALETHQDRYVKQVTPPFIGKDATKEIVDRLGTVFVPDETVQVSCMIGFEDEHGEGFNALGRCDVLRDDIVYELKFVSELKHEHYLQCACYMIALGLTKGVLWNVKDNRMVLITVPDEKKFLTAVAKAVTSSFVRTLSFS